ncbi:MAG: lipoyl(octanoyl) transferase LipB [Thermoleophilia bacterium]
MAHRDGILITSGRVPYAASLEVQAALAEHRRDGRVGDVVWVLEHPPVYTVGRHGAREDLFVSDDHLVTLGASFHRIDRGGAMTWHGPGQTTVYVIRDLRTAGRIREHVEGLVASMSDAAASVGVAGSAPGEDALGLYVEGRKLGSVGVRVRGGITTHGIALNRDPDQMWFTLMTACAAPGVETTSIAREGGDPERGRVDRALVEALQERLGLRLAEGGWDDVPIPRDLAASVEAGEPG